jgi:hypothetical protein
MEAYIEFKYDSSSTTPKIISILQTLIDMKQVKVERLGKFNQAQL